ncbi:hypothetical protein E2320_011833 [Naja naja]|nr:hypothetical protein E2320_011833 [Naja naja]
MGKVPPAQLLLLGVWNSAAACVASPAPSWPLPQMALNGDSSMTKEAIERARQSLDDPNMREFILGCLLLNPGQWLAAHNLLFHWVLFEVHSLKLLAAHCFIIHQYLWPENVVEEKTKELDLSKVMAEIRWAGRLPVQWRYSELSFLELDKFLEDVSHPPLSWGSTGEELAVGRRATPLSLLGPPSLPYLTLSARNGIYPLMNYATVWSHTLEDPQKAQTLTLEPLDVETRKVVQMQCNVEWQEERRQWHVPDPPPHPGRQAPPPAESYDLLPSDNGGDLAAELVHYGFISQDDREKLAAFLEGALQKPRAPPARGAASSPAAGGQKDS